MNDKKQCWSAVSLEGGAAVSAFWAIGAKPVPAPVVEGSVSAEFTMSQMACIDYNASKNYFERSLPMVLRPCATTSIPVLATSSPA